MLPVAVLCIIEGYYDVWRMPTFDTKLFQAISRFIFLIYAPQQRRDDAVMARRLHNRIEVRVVFQDKPKQDSVKVAATPGNSSLGVPGGCGTFNVLSYASQT